MNKVIGILQKAQIAAGGLFLTVFLIAVVIQIASRYIGVSVIWTEDVSLYSFIWAVFMGAAAMVWERRHFAFTSLNDAVKSPAFKLALSLVVSLVILLFALCMCGYGIRITRQFWNYQWVTIPAFKRGPIWLCLPVSGGTMALYAGCLIINDIRAFFRPAKGDS
ncbi:MAG: TRAP transporter small permease subunit [Spirochaetaceae bacterium]|jgi:TRAP-type C4-dicarboxylate transport system permease small subunit|nr:TRAP transporter small permease subunit [Spirochaetaceae bacterium]